MRAYVRSLLVALALNTALPLFAQLNGTYTVGPAGNYATIAAAITALQTNGVSGPVNMDIISGSYSGNWTINTIPGVSGTNKVTFRSQAGLASAVTLTNVAAAPVFTLNNASWIYFLNLTVNSTNNCILLNGASDYVSILSCSLAPGTSYASVTTGTTFTGINTQVSSCTITGGRFGVRLFNIAPSYGQGHHVSSNTITGVTEDGILVDRGSTVVISGNSITSGGTNTATYNDGISVRNGVNAMAIMGNTVNWAIGTTGIYFDSHTYSPGYPPLIENNVVVMSAGNVAGCGISVLSSDNTEVRHNSVRCNVAKSAMQVQFCSGVVLEGNIMQTTTAEGVMVQSGAFASIDRNLYFGSSGNVVRIPPSTFYTLAGWQALGHDPASLYADPLFTSTTDLHIPAASPAISMGPLPSIAFDRDLSARPQPAATRPDAGAYERPEGCTGMSGTYTIGPSAGNDYMSFSNAVLAMLNCGLTGPVTFLVQSGTYAEQLSIPQISGTSATNTITFRSAALDSSAVVLSWPSSGTPANDFTLRMNGGDRVTFDRITIERSGSAGYANVVAFSSTAGTAGSQFTRFDHCRLIGTTAPGSAGYLLTSVANGDEDSVTVRNTRFVNGRSGVLWSTTTDNDLLLIQDNVFVGQSYSGLNLTVRDRGFTIRRNSITVTAATAVGISIGNSTAGFDVSRNSISSAYYAMNLATGISAALGEPRVYDNMLRASNTGMIISGPTNSGLRIDNNSVFGQNYAVYMNAGTITIASFRNNALVSASVVLYRASATASMTLASHNALYRTTAGPFAFWTASQTTMAGLQAASGQFANSVIADPLFYDAPNNDLHAYAMELDASGTPIAHVTTDFDGDTRHASTPDIGADEFTPALWVAPVNTCGACDLITCNGSGTDRWIYKDRRVVARINDNGQNLGTVAMSVYVHSGAVRQSDLGQYYMDRNWNIDTQNSFASPISVRVFCTGAEFATYAAADPLVTTPATAGLVHYDGVLENCLETDNPAGQQWTPLITATGTEPRISIPGATRWFSGDIAKDGELYLTALGQVLPVELLSFTGTRVNEREVLLEWSTATEHDNAGFEVWRMIEGEAAFKEVAWVDGADNSQQTIAYTHLDDNDANGISYYKLKQVDNDGRYEWSDVVAVEGSARGQDLRVYPNPCTHELFIGGDITEGSQLFVLDALGRTVLLIDHASGGAVDVSQLPAGPYYLRAAQPSEQGTVPFIKR